MNQKNRLHLIDKTLSYINKQLSLDLIKPLNLDEEKRIFLKNKGYNPKFVYPKLKKSVFLEYYKKLRKLKFEESILDSIFKNKTNELFNRLRMFENRGKKSFTYYSTKIYGKPDKQLLHSARNLSRLDHRKIVDMSRSIKAVHAAGIFRKELKRLGFRWQVSIEDILAAAQVVPSKKQLLVKEGASFSKKQIRRLIVHEIHTHILRTECGLLQPYRLFATGLDSYEPTEEGLALFKEKRAGVLDRHSSLKGYAGRVLAIHMATQHSFNKTFRFLRKFYPKEKAWQLTVRVKRGLEDTSKKGAFTKDLIYLKGYIDVSNFIKNRSCLHLLHYGKIGIKHTSLIPLIENLKDPEELLRSKKNRLAKDFNKVFW